MFCGKGLVTFWYWPAQVVIRTRPTLCFRGTESSEQECQNDQGEMLIKILELFWIPSVRSLFISCAASMSKVENENAKLPFQNEIRWTNESVDHVDRDTENKIASHSSTESILAGPWRVI